MLWLYSSSNGLLNFPQGLSPNMKKKKSQRTKLKNDLDDLVKLYVKMRDKWVCQYCGLEVHGSNCHASHVIPKSHGDILRWDPENLKVLCYHHHMNWWHKNPMEASKWFETKFPERWEYLKTKKEQEAHFKEFDLEEMKLDLKRKLKELT